tara:strand:- start:42 stop:647 length:606 start_codon:yes stop_codon:yes gene_type:complete
MAIKYNEETGQYEETLPGGQKAVYFDEQFAKRQMSKPGEFQKEQDLIQQAVQAGFGLADAYGGASKAIQRGAQEQSTAAKQMAARSAMAVDGRANLLPAAAGTGIQAAMAAGSIETQAAKDKAALDAARQQALQNAAQFGISALRPNVVGTGAMGYMKTFYEIAAGQGLDVAKNTVNAALASEVDPAVVQDVQSMMSAATE